MLQSPMTCRVAECIWIDYQYQQHLILDCGSAKVRVGVHCTGFRRVAYRVTGVRSSRIGPRVLWTAVNCVRLGHPPGVTDDDR